MTDTPPPYSVLLADASALRPMDLARALAAARKVPVIDLAPAMRRCWGIVEDGVPKEAAAATAAALEAAGFAALAVPASLVEPLPACQAVNTLSFEAGGLSHANRQGGAGHAAHGRLVLLAAASINEVVTEAGPAEPGPDPGKKLLKKTFSMMTGIPTSLGLSAPEASARKEVSEDYLVLDIHLAGPAERLRVDSRRFDFSCLGPHKGFVLAGNLKVLVRLLQEAAPQAGLNHGARILAENRPLREMGYASLADLEREARWRLALTALKA